MIIDNVDGDDVVGVDVDANFDVYDVDFYIDVAIDVAIEISDDQGCTEGYHSMGVSPDLRSQI